MRSRRFFAVAALLAVLALLPLRIGPFGEFVMMIGFVYVIVAAGLHVLVHWAGQISFGHIAFAAIGAHATARLASHGQPFWVAMLAGVAAALAAGLLVGLPALRVRGFSLAIVTFAFGYSADRWLFRQSWLTGASLGGNSVPRPRVFGQELYDAGLYLFILFWVVAVAAGLVRLRRTKAGRAMAAVRDGEELAASYGISVAAYKVIAFMVSAGVAGLAGALWVHALGVADESTFPIRLSILFVSLVVIGGAGSIWGTAVVALSFGVVPSLLGPGPAQWFDLIGPLLLLFVILQYPGGQNQAAREMARQAGTVLARMRGAAAPAPSSPPVVSGPAPEKPRPAPAERHDAPALAVAGLSIRFGGLQALDAVALDAAPGRVTGLIGPNGAGKSTILNCVSGFLRPGSGAISFFGRDISRVSSHARARLGIGRTFQQLSLCLGETVRENLLVAQYRLAAYPAGEGVLGLPRAAAAEEQLRDRADAMLERFGLAHIADRTMRDVPLGTAKLVEIACVLACEPTLMLLDEPTGGLSGKETERLEVLLTGLVEAQGISIVLVTHDMGLLMGWADYVYVLNFGRVLAHGSPEEIRRHAGVVEAYLGTGAAP